MTNIPSDSVAKRVITQLGLGAALSLLGDATLYAVLPDPEIAASAGITIGEVAVLLGVNRIARIVLNGPIGFLYDIASRRLLLVCSLFAGALSTLIYACFSGFWPFLIGRLLWAAAWSGILIGGTTAILDLSNTENRGRLLGKYQMWYFAGTALSSVLGGSLTHLVGFRGGLLVSGLITGLAAVVWLFWLPKTSLQKSEERTPDQTNNSPPKNPIPWKLVITAGIPIFAARLILLGVVNSTTILWLSELAPSGFAWKSISIPAVVLSGSIIASRALVSTAVIRNLGKLSDRLGRRWIIVAGSAISGSIGLIMMANNSLLLAIVGTIAVGAALGGINLLYTVIAGEGTHSGQRGRTIGSVNVFGDFGSALGPLLAIGASPIISPSSVYKICAWLLLLLGVYAAVHSRREAYQKATSQTIVV